MLVSMKRSVFDSLDYAELGWKCIEPTIQQMRGKDITVKSQVYKQLSLGQRALLMFYVLYGHAKSVDEFYLYASHLMLELRAWSEMKNGIRYFGDDAMYLIYEEIEAVLNASNRLVEVKNYENSVVNHNNKFKNLNSAGQLYDLYQKTALETIKRISTYIRNNPDEFILMEN